MNVSGLIFLFHLRRSSVAYNGAVCPVCISLYREFGRVCEKWGVLLMFEEKLLLFSEIVLLYLVI